MWLQTFFFYFNAENMFVENMFSVRALPDISGVNVCFSSALKDVSYQCQEGGGPKTECMTSITPSLHFSRLAVHSLIFNALMTMYVSFSLYATGTDCQSYSRTDGTETVTIYLLGNGVEVDKQSFQYRV